MIIANQNWLIYPDDVEKLRRVIKKCGFSVSYDGKQWHIGKKAATRSKKQKDMTIVADGPWAGVRVEPVEIENVAEFAEQATKHGIFTVTTRQTSSSIYLFIGFDNKRDVYHQRIERNSAKMRD